MKSMMLCGLLMVGLVSGAGAQLEETFKDCFRIGAALNQAQFNERDTRGADIVKAQFNTISPENVLKWESVHPRPDGYDFEQADRYVAFGEKNQMFIIGHTLVWHNQTPKWVFEDDKGAALNREVLLERMRGHIRTVVGRYKGRIKGWDVVNEALNEDGTFRQTPWFRIIGEDYIAKAFGFAHEADPDAELYYNDYSLENEAKRRGAIALIGKLQAQGIRVTAVGLQGHDKMEFPTIEQQAAAIEAFSRLGIKVNITELDIDVLPAKLNPYSDGLPDSVQQALARRYADLFGVFVKYRGVISRVTFWGVTDGDSWLNNWPVKGRTAYPLLFDRNGQPKPAFNAVVGAAVYSKALHDESKVPKYAPPDPLVTLNGETVKDAKTWTEKRRPEILKFFEAYVFGRPMVGRPREMTWKVTVENRHAMDGRVIATEQVKGRRLGVY